MKAKLGGMVNTWKGKRECYQIHGWVSWSANREAALREPSWGGFCFGRIFDRIVFLSAWNNLQACNITLHGTRCLRTAITPYIIFTSKHPVSYDSRLHPSLTGYSPDVDGPGSRVILCKLIGPISLPLCHEVATKISVPISINQTNKKNYTSDNTIL